MPMPVTVRIMQGGYGQPTITLERQGWTPQVGETYQVTVTRGAQTLRIAPQLSHPIVDTMRDLCRILTAVVAVDSDNVSQILNTAWPWTRVLPHSDQLELATEAGAVAETCESLGTWEPLLIVLADWRRTARAYAQGHGPVDVVDVDGRLARRPT